MSAAQGTYIQCLKRVLPFAFFLLPFYLVQVSLFLLDFFFSFLLSLLRFFAVGTEASGLVRAWVTTTTLLATAGRGGASQDASYRPTGIGPPLASVIERMSMGGSSICPGHLISLRW